jgi:hypothetical protein
LAEFNVDESLNGATGRVVISERFARNDGSTGSILGRYTDRYSRLAGGWVFAERRFELIESC